MPPVSTKQILVAGGAIGLGAYALVKAKYFWPWTLKQWLMLVQEEALSPEEEILDAHIHYWDHLTEENRVPVMMALAKIRVFMGTRLLRFIMSLGSDPYQTGFYNMHFGPARSMDSFLDRWLAGEMKKEFNGHKVIGCVYIQCSWEESAPVSETAHQLASKEREGLPTAMVAKLVLADGVEKAEETMNKNLKDAGADPTFLVGFRAYQNSPAVVSDSSNGADPRPLDSQESIAAAKAVGARGFVIDLCVFHNNLPSVTTLAQKAPETTFILDHIGVPIGVGTCAPFGKVLPEWKESMTALSKCPNVYVKLSGMGMSVFGSGFDWGAKPPTSDALVARWGPLYDFVIEAFGIDRCMFASNFPPDSVSCSYNVMWNAYKKMASRFSAEDRRKLLRDNAIKAYNLKL